MEVDNGISLLIFRKFEGEQSRPLLTSERLLLNMYKLFHCASLKIHHRRHYVSSGEELPGTQACVCVCDSTDLCSDVSRFVQECIMDNLKLSPSVTPLLCYRQKMFLYIIIIFLLDSVHHC